MCLSQFIHSKGQGSGPGSIIISSPLDQKIFIFSSLIFLPLLVLLALQRHKPLRSCDVYIHVDNYIYISNITKLICHTIIKFVSKRFLMKYNKISDNIYKTY